MAKKITITITDHGTPCTNYYEVQYKPQSGAVWTNAAQGAVTGDTVTLAPIPDNDDWDCRVRRFCCDGTWSDWITTTFTTL